MKTLAQVDTFGEIAAEDDDLRRYFLETPVFRQLLEGTKQLVVGRKGSGKTALYRAIGDHAKDKQEFASGLTFSDYPWNLHYKYQSATGDRYERFLHSWKFLIYLEIFKLILSDPSTSKRFKDKDQRQALEAVEKFIKSNWGTISFDYKKTFPGNGFKLEGLSFKPQGWGFGVGGVDLEKGDAGLGETVTRLNAWLWHCLATLSKGTPDVFVLFDELDSGFNADSQDYADRVTGLLLAVRAVSKDFQERDLPFRAIAFLRSDIFDALHFGDKNKLKDANTVFLLWNDDTTYHGNSLKEMIDYRIRKLLELGDAKDPWSRAFDDRQMRGTQHKFQHMSFRSYLRPRDIIKFANVALAELKKRMKISGGPALIGNEELAAARKAYSQYLFNELDDEISPTMRSWQDCVEVLRKLTATKFTRAAFARAFEESTVKSKGIGVDEALELLYRYSIIGIERAPGAVGAYHHFRYVDETVRFDANAHSFMVHRGLKEALELADAGEPVD